MFVLFYNPGLVFVSGSTPYLYQRFLFFLAIHHQILSTTLHKVKFQLKLLQLGKNLSSGAECLFPNNNQVKELVIIFTELLDKQEIKLLVNAETHFWLLCIK